MKFSWRPLYQPLGSSGRYDRGRDGHDIFHRLSKKRLVFREMFKCWIYLIQQGYCIWKILWRIVRKGQHFSVQCTVQNTIIITLGTHALTSYVRWHIPNNGCSKTFYIHRNWDSNCKKFRVIFEVSFPCLFVGEITVSNVNWMLLQNTRVDSGHCTVSERKHVLSEQKDFDKKFRLRYLYLH